MFCSTTSTERSSSLARRSSKSRTCRDDHRGEALGRFVHHEKPRIAEQSARYREHLLFAARELSAAVVAALRQSRECRIDPVDRPRMAASARAFAETQRLVDGKTRPEAASLRHEADAGADDLVRLRGRDFASVETHGARPRPHQADDRVAKRRLAHAVAADDRQNAPLQGQRHALKSVRLAIVDLQILHLQDRLRRRNGA